MRGKLISAAAALSVTIVSLSCWVPQRMPFLIEAAESKARFDKSTAEPAADNLKEGLALMRQGNYESATDSLQQAIYFSRNHYNPEAYKYLGLCYKAIRNYGKAIETLKQELNQTTEKEPDVHIDLAECYLKTGDIPGARSEIDKAYIDEDGKGTYRQKFAQGELHENLKDYGQALDFYRGALEQKSNYTEAAMGLARMNLQLKRYNDAIRAYRDILDKGPLFQHVDLEELYNNMGICFFNRGDHQSALDRWRMALKTNPDSYDAHLMLGRMLDEEKHYSSAVKEYEAALRCMPKNGTQQEVIMKRMQYIEAQLAPKEAAPVIKPSPQMRQQYEDSVKDRDGATQAGQAPPRDSGF